MAGKSKISTHPAKKYIELELVKGTPYRDIVGQFSGDISRSSLGRYKRKHLPEQLAKAREAKEVSNADKLLAELARLRIYANKLMEACDRYLTDPEHPDWYDIGPRAHDVDVTYEAEDGQGKTYRRKARMSDLLKLIEKKDILPIEIRWKIADPRELVLKAHKALKEDLELLGRIWGEIKGEGTPGILVTDPVFIEIQALILDAVKDHPEVREKIAHVLDPGE